MSDQGDYENESRLESDNIATTISIERRIKRRYQRHNPHQIEELENFFNECPNPDKMQRSELARRIGLENKQVKFWFQNKRTQTKIIYDRIENEVLRQEHENLVAINMSLKEETKNALCNICHRPVNLNEVTLSYHQDLP